MRAKRGLHGGRVLGYARVSSQEQALGTSLQDQQNALSAYAKARGLTVHRFFVEAESAIHEKFERREQMQRLMREVRSGDLVLCDKVDRWSRDPEFTYRSMRELREVGASVFFVGDMVDPSTQEGDSALNFRVIFSREEHKRIKLRTVGTRRLLRDQGYYVEGLPPLGYRRQLPKGERGVAKNILVIDEANARLVEDVFRRCIRGSSINDLVAFLRSVRRDRAWDKKTVNRLLRNRTFLGEIKDSRGIWIKGKHAALIDAATFARAQDALDARRFGGRKHRDSSHTSSWLLRNIGVCAQCGAKISAAYGGGDDSGRGYIYYYRCGKSCGARYIHVKPNDEAVAAAALQRVVELRDRLGRPEEPALAPAPKPANDVESKLVALEKKRERTIVAFTDGIISRERLHDELSKIDVARTKLDAIKSAELRRPKIVDPKTRLAMLRQVERLQAMWRNASVAMQRDILATLARRVKLARDKPPVVDWRTVEELEGELLS